MYTICTHVYIASILILYVCRHRHPGRQQFPLFKLILRQLAALVHQARVAVEQTAKVERRVWSQSRQSAIIKLSFHQRRHQHRLSRRRWAKEKQVIPLSTLSRIV